MNLLDKATRIGRAPPLLFLLAVAGCSVALFAPLLLRGEVLFFRDVFHYYWPTRFVAAESWAALEVPQWNPFQQAGLPLLADIHAGVLYPANVLFQVWTFPTAYLAFVFLHHVALGAGLLLLLRRLGGEWHAALTGAIVFSLSGYVVGLVNSGPLVAGVALLPWVLWVLASKPVSSRVMVGTAALLGLQALSGDPQSVIYSVLAGSVLVAALPDRKRRAVVFLASLGLAGLLAGVQLLPAWQLWEVSSRSVAVAKSSTEWSLHPLRMLEMVAPLPWGNYLEEPKFWAGALFGGPVPLPFALSVYLGASTAGLVALTRRRGRLLWLGLALILVGFILAAAPHLSMQALLELRPFSFFRYPEKYFVLIALGASFCAAHAASSLQHRLPSWRSLVVTLVAFGVPATLVATGSLDLGKVMLAQFPRLAGAGAGAAAETIPHALGLMAAGGGGLLGAVTLARLSARSGLLKPLIPALVAIDLLASSIPLVWSVSPDLYELRSPIADWLVASGNGDTRVFRDDFGLRQVAPPSRDLRELAGRRAWEMLTLRSNLATIQGVEEMGGYGAVELERTVSAVRALRENPARLMQVFGGRFAVSASNGAPIARDVNLGLAAAMPDLGVSVLENRLWLPKLRAVSRVQGAKSSNDALALLRDLEIDLKNAAIVEGVPSAVLGRAELTSVQFSRSGAGAKVSAEAPGSFVVHASAYYPGWRAFVDGRQVALRPANGAVMGVAVPEGLHEVEFIFSDPMLPWGLACTLVGAFLAIGLVASSILRGRRHARVDQALAQRG